MTHEKWLTKTDAELGNLIDPWFRGIRPIPLKKLLFFTFIVVKRFELIDWNEWESRTSNRKECVARSIKTYLEEKDKTEIEFYMKRLHWSKRTIYDYWNALRIIVTIMTLEPEDFGLKL
jgi:hypothetical protein